MLVIVFASFSIVGDGVIVMVSTESLAMVALFDILEVVVTNEVALHPH